jgi:hypothetical protein
MRHDLPKKANAWNFAVTILADFAKSVYKFMAKTIVLLKSAFFVDRKNCPQLTHIIPNS